LQTTAGGGLSYPQLSATSRGVRDNPQASSDSKDAQEEAGGKTRKRPDAERLATNPAEALKEAAEVHRQGSTFPRWHPPNRRGPHTAATIPRRPTGAPYPTAACPSVKNLGTSSESPRQAPEPPPSRLQTQTVSSGGRGTAWPPRLQRASLNPPRAFSTLSLRGRT